MTEQIKKINNPLTIIAIFAALAEISATVSIGLIDKDLHYIFIWFLIGFPTLLVVLFFLTLNLNTKVMYSPSDYREDKTFLDSLYGQNSKVNNFHINTENLNNKLEQLENKLIKSIDELKKNSNEKLNHENVSEIIEKYKAKIKTEIKTLTNLDDSGLSLNIPSLLKSAIVQWISYPAFITIIYAIIKENCKSVTDLTKVKDKYNFPGKWEDYGLAKLITSGVLVGEKTNFTVNKDIDHELNKWITVNKEIIESIVNLFGNIDSDSENPSVKARALTQNLII